MRKETSKLTIPYSKKRSLTNLISGIIWLLFGIGFFLNTELQYATIAYTLLGLAYLVLFYYEKRHGYLTITNSYVKKNENPFFNEKILLQDIIEVKEFCGDYVLKTGNDRLIINNKIVHHSSKKLLDDVVEGLKLRLNPSRL
ncbi:MAG: hypothetical protein AAF901_11190 [Bacteroidota bacterium]